MTRWIKSFVFVCSSILFLTQSQARAQDFPDNINSPLYLAHGASTLMWTLLLPGQKLLDNNCSCRLEMQWDGNLVVYSGGPYGTTPVWASNTVHDRMGGYTALQYDGNFVVYDYLDNPRWWTSPYPDPANVGGFGSQQSGVNLYNCVVKHYFSGCGGSTCTASENWRSDNVPIDTPSACPTEQGLFGYTKMYLDTDMYGNDYFAFDYLEDSLSVCATQCAYDLPRCRGFTYIPPYRYDPNYGYAKCFLKEAHSQLTSVPDSGWVTGIVLP